MLVGSAWGQDVDQNDAKIRQYFRHCNVILSNEGKDLESLLATDHLSSADRSDLELCRYTLAMWSVDTVLNNPAFHKYHDFWVVVKKQALPLGPDLVELFCAFHPLQEYANSDDRLRTCPDKTVQWIDPKAATKTFNEAVTLNLNVETFVNAEVAEMEGNERNSTNAR